MKNHLPIQKVYIRSYIHFTKKIEIRLAEIDMVILLIRTLIQFVSRNYIFGGEKMDSHHEETILNEPGSFAKMVVITGLFGGLLWSAIGYFAYYLNFIKVEPNIILEPFTVGTWRESWIGIVISIFAYGIISIVVAFLYYAILKKFKTMWVGAVYGIVLFLIVFIILNPIFPSMKPFLKLDLNTIITCVCLYIVYGVFIGYSISYEQNERTHYRDKNKEIKS